MPPRCGEARTLADVEPGEADERQLATWYGQLRSALEYIHSHGVVHRDFKPGNIMLDAQGNAILGDFGISRFIDGEMREELGIETTAEIEKSDSRTVMGSIMFLAPEVRRGENATPASDAYALGVTFYRLLTGIWYEPGPVADGFLAEFGAEWSKALKQLLSDNPASRLPIPSVSASCRSEKRRWWLVGVAVAVCAAIAVLAGRGFQPRSTVGRDHRARHTVGSRVPRDRIEQYTFDQFFPRHTDQPTK